MADISVPRSIRHRLLGLALFPVLLVVPLVIAMAWFWSNEVGYRQLLMKANTDLAVAQESFRATRHNYLLQLALASQSAGLDSLLGALNSHPDRASQAEIAQQIEQLRAEVELDYLRLIDHRRCDLLNVGYCGYPDSPLIRSALAGEWVSGVEVFSGQQLQDLSPALASRALLPLSDTEHSRPTDRSAETRGMMLHLLVPLKNRRGEVVTLLAGGLLMNGNKAFVDQLKATVYGDGSLIEGSRGTVTLFLDDVRISTNVPAPLKPELRALGTRVSEQVRAQVLERGERWLDRAFVVSDWYISGYEPIVDVYGERIGMLYTGFLEAPYKDTFYRWIGQLLMALTILLLLCSYIAVRGARSIFRPVEKMAAVITRIRSGQRLRMGAMSSQDELALLAMEFDKMLDQLEAQHDQIQAAANQLELKVEQRTEALQQHIQLLNRTREQLVAKGKLAAIGELTAGIAHEINNPTAVILGYLDLMMAELGEAGAPVQSEAKLIIEQVERIRSIINSLLQFSRPDDYRTPLTSLNVDALVQDTRLLVRHDLSRKRVQLKLDLRAATKVAANRQLLQQVLINLIVNAVNAMQEGGRLTIRSRDWKDKGVVVVVRDTGCGIAPDALGRIFDPFFSLSSNGTGLGLSISYSILQRMGAEIDVRSRSGVGSCFYLWLNSAKELPSSSADIASDVDKTSETK